MVRTNTYRSVQVLAVLGVLAILLKGDLPLWAAATIILTLGAMICVFEKEYRSIRRRIQGESQPEQADQPSK